MQNPYFNFTFKSLVLSLGISYYQLVLQQITGFTFYNAAFRKNSFEQILAFSDKIVV